MKAALISAKSALVSGDYNSALTHLITAWQTTKHTRLGDLIDRVSQSAPSTPIGGVDAASRQKEWQRRVASTSALDVKPLLDSLLEGIKVPQVGERVLALGAVADPRVPARYVALLQKPPFTASSNKAIWVEILRQLTSVHAEPRTADALAPIAGQYTNVFGETVMGRYMTAQLARLLEKLGYMFPPSCPERQPLSDEINSLFSEIEKILGGSTVETPSSQAAPAESEEEKLLWKIAENPSDETRRAAYESWLSNNGGPRSELLFLEKKRISSGGYLNAKDEKNEQRLLKTCLKEMLGPLSPIVAFPKFERGLLVECMLTPKGSKTAAARGNPRWATVHTLHCTYRRSFRGDMALDPIFKSLRVLKNVTVSLLELLLNDPTPRPIEKIFCTYAPSPKLLPATISAPSLPNLKEFTISCWYSEDNNGSSWNDPNVFRPFLQSPLASRLEVLHWGIFDSSAQALVNELDQHAPDTFRAIVDCRFFRISRGEGGRFNHVEIRIDSTEEELRNVNSRIKTTLRLEPKQLKKIVITAPKTLDLSPLTQQIDSLRSHFTEAEVLIEKA